MTLSLNIDKSLSNRAWFGTKRGLSGKILLLLTLLIVLGMASLGCVQGLQPTGWSGGAISGNTLFVGSKEGKLVAFNIADSGLLWSESLKVQAQGGFFSCAPSAGGAGCASAPAGVAIYGTPAVSDDIVYISGYNGKVYAFDSATLEIRWVYPREGYLQPFVGGLLVAQGNVYFGGSDGKVYALDAATGNLRWDFQTGDKVWSTPVFDGDTIFIGSFDKNLYALDAVTGDEKWSQPFQTEGAIVSSPVVHNGMVYVGSFDRHFYALDAATGGQIWRFPAADDDSTIPSNWFWANPVVHNDAIYAGNLDGMVYSLDLASGELITEFDLQSPISSSPVTINDNIIFATREGVIYKIVTSANELERLTSVDAEIYGPLAANEGIIYIHTQDLTLRRVSANTGSVLSSVSIKAPEQESAPRTTNWGFLIAIGAIVLVVTIVMSVLRRRRA